VLQGGPVLLQPQDQSWDTAKVTETETVAQERGQRVSARGLTRIRVWLLPLLPLALVRALALASTWMVLLMLLLLLKPLVMLTLTL